MKDKKENILIEYDYIKAEIQNKIELHNKLITFTITTVVAVLAFAFSEKDPFLFLTPFCILIPMSSRITYYRLALSKLSAYAIVFLEPFLDGCEWERRNYLIVKQIIGNKRKSTKKSITMHYYDLFILGLVCYWCFLYYYIPDKTFCFFTIFNILWPVILLWYEFVLARRMNGGDKMKEKWIYYWSNLIDIEIAHQANDNNFYRNK